MKVFLFVFSLFVVLKGSYQMDVIVLSPVNNSRIAATSSSDCNVVVSYQLINLNYSLYLENKLKTALRIDGQLFVLEPPATKITIQTTLGKHLIEVNLLDPSGLALLEQWNTVHCEIILKTQYFVPTTQFTVIEDWQIVPDNLQIQFRGHYQHGKIPEPWNMAAIWQQTVLWLPIYPYSTFASLRHSVVAALTNSVDVNCMSLFIANGNISFSAEAIVMETDLFKTQQNLRLLNELKENFLSFRPTGPFSCSCSDVDNKYSCTKEKQAYDSCQQSDCSALYQTYVSCADVCSIHNEIFLDQAEQQTCSANAAPKLSILTCNSLPVMEQAVEEFCTCSNCGYEQGKVLVFYDGTNHSSEDHMVLGKNRHTSARTMIEARYEPVDSRKCAIEFERPVFIMSVLLVEHLYHLMFDLMAPLYATIVNEYFHGRSNVTSAEVLALRPLLYVSVHDVEQRRVLQQSFRKMFDQKCSTYLCVFASLFTEVHSLDSLKKSPQRVCFKKLYIGADMRHQFLLFALSRHRQHAIMSPDPNLVNGVADYFEIIERQLVFNKFVVDFLSEKVSVKAPNAKRVSVLFIKREQGRSFSNYEDVRASMGEVLQNISIANPEYQIGLKVSSLTGMHFMQQFAMFQDTNLFIASSGMAVSNLMFLPPRSVLLLFIHPAIFGWRHIYHNLAVASGVKVVMYKQAEVRDDFAGWEHKELTADLKHGNLTIDPLRFADALREAIGLLI